jgi:centromere/kinetochore protein ZW10
LGKFEGTDGDGEALAETLSNAETQERFLQAELRFNETLANVLGRLQLIGTTLAQADAALNTGEFDETVVENLDSAEQTLEKLEGLDGIIVVGLMKEKAKGLRKLLVNKVESAWNSLVQVDKDKRFVKILKVAESRTHHLRIRP